MKNPRHRPAVFVVPHSHWDREWYLPFETFRYRLCCLVDELLDILDADPDYQHFMFDGQTVLLEDVVALRPDLAPRLREHIGAGRISIGPWYVLQDEFLVSGESLVRNLLVGRRAARGFGATMPVGYIPDAFGHVSQIPRVLQGFGLDGAVLWRGVGDQASTNEWTWRAPGGAEVLVLWLRWNYSSAECLPNDLDAVHGKLRHDLDRMAGESQAGVLLWMNGTDHHWPQPHLPELLAGLREREPGVEIVHTHLEEALATARTRLEGASLEVVEGELRRTGPGVGFLLPGVLSARMWQQRDHDEAEWRLSREAEPFATVAGLNCDGSLDYAWRTLLKCQPHDSICGCSVDEVHREVAVRQDAVEQLAREIRDHGIRAMGEEPAGLPGRIDRSPSPGALLVANPHPFTVSPRVETEMVLPPASVPFRVMGPGGEVPSSILWDEPEDRTLPDDRVGRRSRRVRVELRPGVLPPLGIQALTLVPGAPAAGGQGIQREGDRISNDLVAVQPVPGGLQVDDLTTGTRLRLRLEDTGDRGDEYNYCPVDSLEPLWSTDAHTTWKVETDPVKGTAHVSLDWQLPLEVSEDRASRQGSGRLTARLTAHVLPGERSVDLGVEIDNTVRDHRLRLCVDSGERPDTMVTDGPLDWIPRPAGEPPAAPGSEELPVPTHPMCSMATVALSGARFGVGGVGLREVELASDGSLYVTLIRCVEWLSRSDLTNRLREAGPAMWTPEAQGLGTHRFQMALGFNDTAEPASALHRVLEPILHPPVALPVHRATLTERSGLEIQPASIRLSGLKRTEDGEGVVVRLVGADAGSTATPTTVRWWGPVVSAHLSDLDERSGQDLPIQREGEHAVISLAVAPRDVATVVLNLA